MGYMGKAQSVLSAVVEGDLMGALAVLRADLGARAVGMTSRGPSGVSQTWLGLPEELDREYVSYYHAHDPWVAGAVRLGLAAGRAYTSAELLTDEDRLKNPMLHELCIPLDLPELEAGVVHLDATEVTTIGVMRHGAADPFTIEDRAKLEGWLPCLATARRIQRAAEAPFGKVVLLVDAQGRLVDRDARAHTLFDTGALAFLRGRLALRFPADDVRLARAVRTVADGDGKCVVVRLADPALRLVVARPAPLPSMVALEILGPTALPAARLRALFGLSEAEAQLVGALVDGLTLKEIATRRGVAVTTVRSQLRSVFLKTETERQADLVALVLRVSA
ncbi:MAG: helix-turn-helix domain-containing protein [Myxococcales bacterium]|nr:helix-turn-helix domain-containing protein [Myxococcales bacterium]